LLGGALAGSGPGTSPCIDGLSLVSGMVVPQHPACSNHLQDDRWCPARSTTTGAAPRPPAEDPADSSSRESSGQVVLTKAPAAPRRRDPTSPAPAQPLGADAAGVDGAPRDWAPGGRNTDTARLRAPTSPFGSRSLTQPFGVRSTQETLKPTVTLVAPWSARRAAAWCGRTPTSHTVPGATPAAPGVCSTLA
jgi:hypothetical protein